MWKVFAIFASSFVHLMLAYSINKDEIYATSAIVKAVLEDNGFQFCTIIYRDLNDLEIQNLMSRTEKAAFFHGEIKEMFKKKNINEARMTSSCIIHVSRNITDSDLETSSHFLPLAKFVVLSAPNFIQPRHEYIQPFITFLSVGASANIIQHMNCQEEPINVWKNGNFLKPIKTMFKACPQPLDLVKNRNFVGYGYGYAPYFTTNENDEIDGMDVLVLKLLASHFGFQLDVKRSAGWDKVVDGQWTNGTIGQVYHGKSQFGIGSLAFTTARYSAVDYTHFTFFCGVRFFMRKPGPVNPYLKALQPIDYFGWIGFVTFSALIGLLLILVAWMHPNLNSITKNLDFHLRISYGVFLMLFHPCNFGSERDTKKIRKRSLAGAIVITSWLFGITTFVFFYEATLRATLLAIQYENPVNSVQESLDKEIPLIILSKSTFIKNNMAYATNPLYRKSWALAEEKDLFYLPTLKDPVPEDLLEEVVNSDKAVMILDGVFEAVANRYFIKHREQPFYAMKETVIPFFSGFTMAKDHYPVKILMDRAIERLVEAGIVMNFMSKWVPPDLNEKVKIDQESQVMDLWHFESTFMIYAICMIVSFLVFIMERSTKSTSSKRPSEINH